MLYTEDAIGLGRCIGGFSWSLHCGGNGNGGGASSMALVGAGVCWVLSFADNCRGVLSWPDDDAFSFNNPMSIMDAC
jgi:hypothetical protein